MDHALIKVCGMRDAENIREVEQLAQPSTLLLGFIFWPKSSRYVSEPPAYLPQKAKRVGVFVDATVEDICRHINDYALDFVQLHGHESPDFIRHLNGRCSIIKAINMATKEDLQCVKPYEGLVDYFLFDTRMPLKETGDGLQPGGTGKKFDWSVLSDYDGQTPFLLSGGIGPDDAERVRAFHHEKCIGIDLNSRFELAPAYKDIQKLKSFIEQL